MKVEKIIFPLLLLITASIMPLFRAQSSSTTTLTFQPNPSITLFGESIKINIKVIDVTNLNNWQITVDFNPKIITCKSITVPEGNIFYGYNWFFPTPKIDNVNGRLSAFCAVEGNVGVSGSGTLCTITFEIKALGVSTTTFLNPNIYTLDGTYLQNPNYNLIPFEPTIGVIQIIGPNFIENTFTINYGTETLTIKTLSNSTISSPSYSQTTKTLSYQATGPDGTKGACIITIPQKIMNTTLIALSDNTPLKTFIKEFNTLPENGTHNFLYYTYAHSTHTIKILQTIIGDITGDRKVDMRDVALASKSFGSTPTSPNYRPVADLNQDDRVDMKDISIISKNFGKYLLP
ncbi:MAG: dockerin type I domain-containing protein [Nitrososphaerota archaeon]